MKYVITGGAGHISKPLTEALLAAGHQVIVIGRNAANLQELVNKGATAAAGDLNDAAYLQRAFAGASAVYLMNPPNFATDDIVGTYERIAENYAAAIKANKVPYVVHLSSVGAHRSEGIGPVNGLFRAERALNATGAHVLHLRPSYFYYNLFSNIDLIKHMGIMGSNFALSAGQFPIADPSDIAAVATDALLKLDFTGQSVRNIASDEVGTDEIAAAIGQAIGKPDLKWIQFPDDQAKAGMLQAGLNEEMSSKYVEMGNALLSGIMLEDYWKHRPVLAR